MWLKTLDLFLETKEKYHYKAIVGLFWFKIRAFDLVTTFSIAIC
jgi:hypothetical protein